MAIAVREEEKFNERYKAAPPGGSDIKIPILIGSVIALLGANIYLFTQLNGLRSDFGDFRKSTQTEISSLKESSTVSTQTARRSLTTLKDELEAARRQASMAAGQARVEAQKACRRTRETLATRAGAPGKSRRSDEDGTNRSGHQCREDRDNENRRSQRGSRQRKDGSADAPNRNSTKRSRI